MCICIDNATEIKPFRHRQKRKQKHQFDPKINEIIAESSAVAKNADHFLG